MTDWLGMATRPRVPRPELKVQVLGRAARPRVRWGRSIAAAAAIAGLAAGGWWLRDTITTLERERDRLAAELAAVRDTVGFLVGASTRVVTVPVSTGGRVGAVTILTDSATRRWLVRCEGMAPNEPDQTYQLWFITEAGMKHAALMTMGESPVMAMTLAEPDSIGRVVGAAMSIEPRRGSDTPQGPIVFHLRL